MNLTGACCLHQTHLQVCQWEAILLQAAYRVADLHEKLDILIRDYLERALAEANYIIKRAFPTVARPTSWRVEFLSCTEISAAGS